MLSSEQAATVSVQRKKGRRAGAEGEGAAVKQDGEKRASTVAGRATSKGERKNAHERASLRAGKVR